MTEIVMAAALVLVIEGLLYAVFPSQLRHMMLFMLTQSIEQWRIVGITTATIGVGIVWAMKTFGGP